MRIGGTGINVQIGQEQLGKHQPGECKVKQQEEHDRTRLCLQENKDNHTQGCDAGQKGDEQIKEEQMLHDPQPRVLY